MLLTTAAKKRGYTIRGHLFTSHWITKVPIVLYFILQKILIRVKQVVQIKVALLSLIATKRNTNRGYSADIKNVIKEGDHRGCFHTKMLTNMVI